MDSDRNRAEVSPVFQDKAYYLGPDKGGDRAYALLPERRPIRILAVSPGNLYLAAALLLDDRELGRLLMREAEHHARFEQRPPDTAATGAMRCLSELRRHVDAMHLPATGASALTEAELKVMRLLPTNLSLAEMATRLFVSRNTVKSHAASIYRKLGASNRGQAVEVAAAAGLIESI